MDNSSFKARILDLDILFDCMKFNLQVYTKCSPLAAKSYCYLMSSDSSSILNLSYSAITASILSKSILADFSDVERMEYDNFVNKSEFYYP